MSLVLVVVRQVIIMFVMVMCGTLLYHGHKLSMDGVRNMGNILIYLVIPCVIIRSFQLERTPETMRGLLFSGIAGLAVLCLSVLVSHLTFRKDGIAAFASAFSNPGFFGIPLITAVLGQEAVFYAAFFIAFLNLGQWTWGISTMTGESPRKGFSLNRLMKAPFVVAIVVGLILYFTGLQLPEIVNSCLSSIAAVNTPMAMICIGVYLAQTPIRHMLMQKKLYLILLMRLLVIPLLSLALLLIFPASMRDMRLAVLLEAACPVGANIAVYAQIHHQNYTYAVETVIFSTLLSIATLPLITYLAGLLL